MKNAAAPSQPDSETGLAQCSLKDSPNRRVLLCTMWFGFTMLGLTLVLPFLLASREIQLGLTVLQLGLWLVFSGSMILLGDWLEKSGQGLVPVVESNATQPRRFGSKKEIALFLGAFAPSCFAYLYVTYLNTGYFGFNFVLMFMVAGYATNYFPFWITLVFVVAETFAWAALGRAMFGGWMRIEDVLTTFSGFLFSVMMFFLLRKERTSRFQAEALSRQLDSANERLREYAAQVEELSATQERNRIAREIHDTLGHSLTVVNMQLETARALLSSDMEKAAGFVEKAQTMTKKGLADVRASVASLRSSPLSGKTLEQCLQGLLDASRSAGLEAEFSALGEPRPLTEAVERALFRTAQEGLTNVRKHARAKRVTLELDYRTPERVTLKVRDDGVGCELASGGFGLIGIRERVQLLNGEAAIATAPGAGLELTVTVAS